MGGGGKRIAPLVHLPCFLSLCFDMGEQEIKKWGKGGVQRAEPPKVPRLCTYFYTQQSGRNIVRCRLFHLFLFMTLRHLRSSRTVFIFMHI